MEIVKALGLCYGYLTYTVETTTQLVILTNYFFSLQSPNYRQFQNEILAYPLLVVQILFAITFAECHLVLVYQTLKAVHQIVDQNAALMKTVQVTLLV